LLVCNLTHTPDPSLMRLIYTATLLERMGFRPWARSSQVICKLENTRIFFFQSPDV
jgi:hypothetical protein